MTPARWLNIRSLNILGGTTKLDGKICNGNLGLLIQPLICFNWTQRWLAVFPIASLQLGFEQLMPKMNQFVRLCIG